MHTLYEGAPYQSVFIFVLFSFHSSLLIHIHWAHIPALKSIRAFVDQWCYKFKKPKKKNSPKTHNKSKGIKGKNNNENREKKKKTNEKIRRAYKGNKKNFVSLPSCVEWSMFVGRDHLRFSTKSNRNLTKKKKRRRWNLSIDGWMDGCESTFISVQTNILLSICFIKGFFSFLETSPFLFFFGVSIEKEFHCVGFFLRI